MRKTTLIAAAAMAAGLVATAPAVLAQPESAEPQAPAPTAPIAVQPLPPPAAPPSPPQDKRDKFDLSADIGAGFLEFFHVDLAYLTTGRQLRRLLAFGIGVGGFPLDKALSVLMKTDDLGASASLAGITLAGSVETELVSFRIFGRCFPWRKAFFVELSGEAWRLRVGAKGTVTAEDEEYGELIEIKADAEVWVPMIGLHGGWRILWKSGAFLEIAGGLNVFLSPGAEVTLGGTTIDQLQGYPKAAAK